MAFELTEEHTKHFDEYVKKWTTIGLSTGKTDRKKAETCVLRAYKAADLAEPGEMFWAQSPLGCLETYRDERKKEKDKPTLDEIRAQIDNFCYGCHDAAFLSYYDFFLRVCGIKQCEIFLPLIELAEVCGWWLPYVGAVIASDQPTAVHLNAAKQLHKDGGPALAFSDGFALYSLNGVSVTKEIAETPGEALDPKLVVSERLADVRREIFRKIGAERVFKKLGGKLIHKAKHGGQEYELVTLNLGDTRVRPFLYMENPSLPGTFHLEGVAPECTTVAQAIEWRNQSKETPEVLT